MTPHFTEQFVIADEMFRKFHKDKLKKDGPRRGKTTWLTAEVILDIPTEVIKFYLWCSLNIRIKTLNRSINTDKIYKKLLKLLVETCTD